MLKGKDIDRWAVAVGILTASLAIVQHGAMMYWAALTEADGKPLGPNQIAAATGIKAGNARRLLQRLKADGLITTTSYGKYILNIDPNPADGADNPDDWSFNREYN